LRLGQGGVDPGVHRSLEPRQDPAIRIGVLLVQPTGIEPGHDPLQLGRLAGNPEVFRQLHRVVRSQTDPYPLAQGPPKLLLVPLVLAAHQVEVVGAVGLLQRVEQRAEILDPPDSRVSDPRPLESLDHAERRGTQGRGGGDQETQRKVRISGRCPSPLRGGRGLSDHPAGGGQHHRRCEPGEPELGSHDESSLVNEMFLNIAQAQAGFPRDRWSKKRGGSRTAAPTPDFPTLSVYSPTAARVLAAWTSGAPSRLIPRRTGRGSWPPARGDPPLRSQPWPRLGPGDGRGSSPSHRGSSSGDARGCRS
jgi:hypothetical protein